jgi:hypothetical protein
LIGFERLYRTRPLRILSDVGAGSLGFLFALINLPKPSVGAGSLGFLFALINLPKPAQFNYQQSLQIQPDFKKWWVRCAYPPYVLEVKKD